MFGESDSESPRVPSPWDTIISTPPSPSPSPLIAAIPKLVPEQDDGNVEYKLQLLSPSPARFARLVTQMKWRLLEGGGQAYYELGVADSGMLVGLPRAELEQSLETLDAMAGEIGASVIVVKEIEVPAVMAGLVGTQTDSWNGKRARRRQALIGFEESADESATSTSYTTTTTETETETEMSATDVDEEDHFASTAILPLPSGKLHTASDPNDVAIFSMDDFDSAAEYEYADESSDPDGSPSPPRRTQFSTIDLEIASVFKPRPVRAKAASNGPLPPPVKNKRERKIKKGVVGKHLPDSLSVPSSVSVSPPAATPPAVKPLSNKASNRRQARDRKREERRAALMMYATAASGPVVAPTTTPTTQETETANDGEQDEAACAIDPTATDADAALVSSLGALHVSVEPVPVSVLVAEHTIPALELSLSPDAAVVEDQCEDGEDGEDDVFPSPHLAMPVPFTAFASQLTVPVDRGHTNGDKHENGNGAPVLSPRLIVEALVVRKMSLEEAFLDFGGFSLT
ncbi:hypothetical protein C8F04DRAFT_1074819 [Mycena alexandri]|uniref:GTP binding protein 2 n=1 Tax=Mycena alexandri TaxID=1745969 RepID=A0AAD6TAG2_9AGAR|nr:hypothetical protein C8F04DRAFT_1074819 [Mycena alexandri]